jgi:hypothetical protein
MTRLNADDVRRINAAAPRIPIDEARLAELPDELAQFADAIERVRSELAFETEIADFPAVLIACAEDSSRDR